MDKLLFPTATVLLLAGCSDLGAPLRLVPHGELSATALDFGTVAVNDAATRSVQVGNSGTADLAGFAAVACADYSIESGGGAFTVPPGGTHTVVVRYQPSQAGASSCTLTLGDGLPPVPLSGAGALQAPGAACSVSVPVLDFGTLSVGSSKQASFTVRSTGTAPVMLNVVSSCGEFTLTAGGGARTLAPGDSLLVTVSFAPSAGGHFACTIATGPGCPDVTTSGDATSVSFASQILPIFNTRGCNSGCHTTFFRRTTDLVNVPSPGYAPAVRIKPYDPAGSVLYGKITNSMQYGQLMPQGGPLIPVAERDRIRTWILEGAHDN